MWNRDDPSSRSPARESLLVEHQPGYGSSSSRPYYSAEELLLCAASSGSVSIVESVLKLLDPLRPCALVGAARAAARFGHFDIFELLQDHRDIPKNAMVFCLYVVEMLENKRQDFLGWIESIDLRRSDWVMAFEIACGFGFFEALPVLYEKVVGRMNLDDCLIDAARSCSPQTWSFIRSKQGGPPNLKLHPLILACSFCDVKVVTFLLSCDDIKCEFCSSVGRRAAQIARESRNIEIIRLMTVAESLLNEDRAELIVMERKGRTSPHPRPIAESFPFKECASELFHAALAQSSEAIAALIEIGIGINDLFGDGRLPITSVSESEGLRQLQRLL
jgi:hypothetical protein